MARVLFFGAPIAAPAGAGLTPRQRFDATGMNTGNTLIGNSLFRQLAVESHAFGLGVDPATVNAEFDLIAIPAANFLYHRFDFAPYAAFLEKTALPCLMVGLGAQAPSTTAAAAQAIPAGTRRFIDIVADRCSTIGVRGYYTAEVMAAMGWKNVRVTGCPSLYRTLTPSLALAKRAAGAPLKVSLNGSRNVIEHSDDPARAASVERQLIEIGQSRGYDYVLQNEFPEIDIVSGDAAAPSDGLDVVQAILGRIGSDLAPAAYRDYMRAHGRVFFDVAAWEDYIRGADFSVGTRFHGNIIALTSGVPAVIFTHDSRTTEMCRLMHIPHLPVSDVERIDVELLYQTVDFADFATHYAFLYRRYAEFLDENGVAHRLNAGRAVAEGGRLDAYAERLRRSA